MARASWQRLAAGRTCSGLPPARTLLVGSGVTSLGEDGPAESRTGPSVAVHFDVVTGPQAPA